MATDPYIGEIMIYPYTFAPRGWASCEGQLLDISQHSALFSLLGTIYGGDGRTTFGLPDLRGRVVLGLGHGAGLTNYGQGMKGGNESVTLTAATTPTQPHTHTATATAHAFRGISGQSRAPGPQYIWGQESSAFTKIYWNGSPNTTMSPEAVTVQVDPYPPSSARSSDEAQENVDLRQPFQVLRYCIALEGVFPSRS